MPLPIDEPDPAKAELPITFPSIRPFIVPAVAVDEVPIVTACDVLLGPEVARRLSLIIVLVINRQVKLLEKN
jgi:hypothetical protein